MNFANRRRNTIVMVVVAVLACTLAPLSATWLDTVILTGVFALISLSCGLSFGRGAFAAFGQ